MLLVTQSKSRNISKKKKKGTRKKKKRHRQCWPDLFAVIVSNCYGGKVQDRPSFGKPFHLVTFDQFPIRPKIQKHHHINASTTIMVLCSFLFLFKSLVVLLVLNWSVSPSPYLLVCSFFMFRVSPAKNSSNKLPLSALEIQLSANKQLRFLRTKHPH